MFDLAVSSVVRFVISNTYYGMQTINYNVV